VQIVSARSYQARLETQSFRTVRVPAVRGKILDCNGVALAENRPRFNIGLYLEELSPKFRAAYQRARPRHAVTNAPPFWKRWLGVSAVKTQLVKLNRAESDALEWEVRTTVVSNTVAELAQRLQQPLPFDPSAFRRHYQARRALPYPALVNLDAAQVARFQEQGPGPLGADLEIQSLRVYPFQATAAHVLGFLTSDDTSYPGEEASPSYRLPDYRGLVGIEGGFDTQLRGRAGAKSVLVNILGYRQSEVVWNAAEPGRNVVLTLDVRLQKAVEHALVRSGVNVRGAAVVMDVHNGDILALVSVPAPNPNHYVQGFPPGEYEKLNHETLRPQINRATQENYAPGSIFKVVVALACLENGLDPHAMYRVQPNPANPGRGIIHVGRQPFRDTAPPGDYDFRRALLRSSNAYFITNGIRVAGIEGIVRLGQKLHLGERVNLPTRQETAGSFPNLRRVTASNWRDGDTANVCIGQGPIDVTPLQMAVMTAAIANGGTVFWPRLVAGLEPQADDPGLLPVEFPAARVRNSLGVSARSLRLLHEAMLADTEDEEGTGRAARVPGLRICGKTGTAQVTDANNRLTGYTTWFISFAPYEHPRHAVVVMVEDGGSGGGTCAPVAREIYAAIQRIETAGRGTLAHVE
jgi:penicillin-binding protein 2